MFSLHQLKSRLPWVRARVEHQQFVNTLEQMRQDKLAEQYGLHGVKHQQSAEGLMFDAIRLAEVDMLFGESRPAVAVSRPLFSESARMTPLQERMAELELALEDRNWLRLAAETNREFSRQGLRAIMMLSRLFYLKNPLINRAVEIKALYVWAQGINITASDPDVNEVIQGFMGDSGNRAEMFGHQARRLKEVELEVMGNLFFAFFPNTSSGDVRLRTIPVDEIAMIHTNPDDAKETWFYERVWTPASIDPMSGAPQIFPSRTILYPDWQYTPKAKDAKYGTKDIEWDTPVYHVKIGSLPDMRFGTPETYAALDWARAYKEICEAWQTVNKALAIWTWDIAMKTGGQKAVQAGQTKLATTAATGNMQMIDSNPPPVMGSMFVHTAGVEAQPYRMGGVQASLEDARRIGLMVGSATGIPETMLMEDVSKGAHATAQTLDRPTELMMRDRQSLWEEIVQNILQFVIECSAMAPNGALAGRLAVKTNGPIRLSGIGIGPAEDLVDRHIDVSFPPVLQADVGESIAAVVAAATLGGNPLAGTIPDVKVVARLLLERIGVNDLDDMMERLFPADAEMQGATERKLVKAIEALTEAVGNDGLKLLTEYSEDQPHASNGEWGEGSTVEMIVSDRVQRAVNSQVRTGVKEQAIADAQERIISKAIGVPRTSDNSAFDLRNAKTGVEIKTMLSSKNGKVTMSKAALARKNEEIKTAKIKAYTVVADKRGGGTKYYISKGVGSFRVSNMTPTTIKGIRGFLK